MTQYPQGSQLPLGPLLRCESIRGRARLPTLALDAPVDPEETWSRSYSHPFRIAHCPEREAVTDPLTSDVVHYLLARGGRLEGGWILYQHSLGTWTGRMLYPARNGTSCSPGADTGWLVMVAALEPDRRAGAFSRAYLNSSC